MAVPRFVITRLATVANAVLDALASVSVLVAEHLAFFYRFVLVQDDVVSADAAFHMMDVAVDWSRHAFRGRFRVRFSIAGLRVLLIVVKVVSLSDATGNVGTGTEPTLSFFRTGPGAAVVSVGIDTHARRSPCCAGGRAFFRR